MTREEARPFARQLLTIIGASDVHPDSKAEMLISAFRNLGMLKLDEPRDGPLIADCNFGKAFLLFGSEQFNSADHMMRAFAAAGLHIVEK